MKQITLVTGNMDKVRLVENILGMKVNHVDIDVDEIQEMDTHKIAEHKAQQAWNEVKNPVVIWDQSLEIACLNGFPGPLIKWFWTTVTLEKICQIANSFKDHRISTKTTITYFDGEKMEHFHGETKGSIPTEPRGTMGFGWDPIFIPEGQDLTNAEIDPNNKDFLYKSLREALMKLKNFLNKE